MNAAQSKGPRLFRVRGNYEGLARSPAELRERQARRRHAEHLKFLDQLYAVSDEHEGKAMRLLYKHIDELLMAGHFDSCNELLKSFELSRVKDLLWGGLLTITFAAREKLPERARLYSKIFNRLSESRTPAKANELLQGLK